MAKPSKSAQSDIPPEEPRRPDHANPSARLVNRKSRRWLRGVVKFVVVFVVLVAILIALAPMLLSTGPGTQWLVGMIEPVTKGELEVEDLSLSWFSGQSLRGVTYRADDGTLSLDIGEASAVDVSLLRAIFGSMQFGTVQLTDVQGVYAVLDPSEQTEEKRAEEDAPAEPNVDPQPDPPGPAASQKPFELPHDLSITLQVNNFDVRFQAPDMQEVHLTSEKSSVGVDMGRHVKLNVDAKVQQGERTGRLTSTGDILDFANPQGQLQPALADYQVTTRATNLPIDGVCRALSERQWPNPAADYLLGKRGRLAAMLGGETLDARLSLDGVPNQIKGEFEVNTENLQVDLPLLREGGRVVIAEAAKLRWDLTPAGFTALFDKSGLTLDEAIRIESRRISADLPRKGNAVDIDAAALTLLLAGEDATMTDTRGRKIEVADLRIGLNSQSLSTRIAGRLEAKVTAPDEDGQLVAGLLQADLMGDQLFTPQRRVSFVSEKLPIVLIDALGGFEDNLIVWLGSTLDLDLIAQGQLLQDAAGPRVVYDFSLAPESSRIVGELPGRIDGQRITAATPFQEPFEITLRSEGFSKLMSLLSGDPDRPVLRFASDQTMTAYVTINDVSFATDPTRSAKGVMFLKPAQTYADIAIQLTPATLADPRNDKIYELRSGKIEGRLTGGNFEGQLDLQLWVPPDAGDEGFASVLMLQTSTFDIIDSTGKLPLTKPAFAEQIRLDNQISLTDTPSALFDSLLNRNGDLAAVLGPVVNDLDVQFKLDGGKPTGAMVRLNWDDRINGPIAGAWASMRPVELNIDDAGMMTIADKQDVLLELKIHPELGDRWLGKLNPVLFDAKSGDRPVQIRIDGKSFRYPIGTGSMQGANVQAMVDLGSVEFAEQALLGKMLEWTDRAGNRAVFNPARVTLKDSTIQYEQLDLSVGNVQLRFDGTVDVANGEIVEMALRVPASSLTSVFDELQGIIPEDDFLSIDMTGSIRKPNFDRSKITREVTRLLTANALKRQEQRLKDKIREEIGVNDNSPEGEIINSTFDFIRRGIERAKDNK